jgi:hypothetical protein
MFVLFYAYRHRQEHNAVMMMIDVADGHWSLVQVGPLHISPNQAYYVRKASVREHLGTSRNCGNREGGSSDTWQTPTSSFNNRALQHQFLHNAGIVHIDLYPFLNSPKPVTRSLQLETDAALSVRNPHLDLDREPLKLELRLRPVFFFSRVLTNRQHASGCEGKLAVAVSRVR